MTNGTRPRRTVSPRSLPRYKVVLRQVEAGACRNHGRRCARRSSTRSAPNMLSRRIAVALLAAALALPAGAAQWTATFGRVGPLKLGMSLASVNRVLGEHFSAPGIRGADPSGRCFYVDPSREPAVELMIIDGRLARIDVVKSGVETAKGISVGDTEAAVLAAYRPRISIAPAAYDPRLGKFLTVLSPDEAYGIRFVTSRGKVQSYYSGTVQAIRNVEGCG